MNLPPLVSISCLTFNHVDYIRKCLDGFMMQDCNFDFEVLIHDDASTDATAEIIKEYQSMYPNIIKPIIQIENQWSKGIRDITLKYNISRAKGKYIAFCEGDDYWTDPLKLQKQVDFLESNPDYILCFHDCRYSKDGNLAERFLEKYELNSSREITALEFRNWWAQTATIVFKNDPLIYKRMSSVQTVIYADAIFRCAIVEFGKIYFINEVMSVYRIHSGGVTSISNNNKKDFKKIQQFLEMQIVFNISLSQPIAKSYYFISLRYFLAGNYLSFVKYFSLAVRHNPSDVFHRVAAKLMTPFQTN